MSGMNSQTGRRLTPRAHLAQSIADILSTPIGSRVWVRDYGSALPRLIDAPINGATRIDLFAATAEAIDLWEPRFALRRVAITSADAGRVDLVLTGDVDDAEVTLEIEVGR